MADRKDILAYVKDKYQVEPDYPWKTSPSHAVLRHEGSRKWFGLIMNISERKLGLERNCLVDVINLKCDPLLAGSLRNTPGIFPAYHMNKEHWITALLGGSLPDEKIFDLIDLSYHITQKGR